MANGWKPLAIGISVLMGLVGHQLYVERRVAFIEGNRFTSDQGAALKADLNVREAHLRASMSALRESLALRPTHKDVEQAVERLRRDIEALAQLVTQVRLDIVAVKQSLEHGQPSRSSRPRLNP